METKLPKEIDRNKIYYMVTNEKENHNGLQYHDGLVEDFRPFNEKASCCEEGIYFTTIDYIYDFLYNGRYVRPLTIPEEAKVVLNPEGDKYRADKVFMLPKISIKDFLLQLVKEKKFDWKYYSYCLPELAYEEFEQWWDKRRYNYKKASAMLAIYCSDKFDQWFDKKRFNYKEDSWTLAIYCSDKFDQWFDKSRFNYTTASWALVKFCSDHFDKWFDKKRFNYTTTSWALAKFCSDQFNKWFDKNLYNYRLGSEELAVYCSKHFEQWYDEEKFNPKKRLKLLLLLEQYCSEFKHIWSKP